jgi:hypothetical protein
VLAGDFSAIVQHDRHRGGRNAPAVCRKPHSVQPPLRKRPYFNKYLTTAAVPSGVVTFSPSTAVNEDQLTAKFDQTFNDRHRASSRLLPMTTG